MKPGDDLFHLDVGEEKNVPHRIINKQIVSYPWERTTVIAGKKIVKHGVLSFTVGSLERIEQ